MNQEAKLGLQLIIKDQLNFEELHVIFNTRNLTRTLTEPGKMLPCIFFSHYMPKIFTSNSDHQSPIVLPDGLDSAELKQLPITKCLRHGTCSFLPYDYAKTLPEYSYTIQLQPEFRVIHSFNDCVLEFPIAHPVGSSIQPLHEKCLMKKFCYQCLGRLYDESDSYIFRNCLLCSPECRGDAVLTHYWYERMMTALRTYLNEIEAHENMDGETIFTIEP